VTEIAERYRNVANQFTSRVRAVPASEWDNPSPCEGWVARDIVRHLVEWVPGFLSSGAGVEMPPLLSVDVDPIGAWEGLDRALQSLLDDPESAAREFFNEHTGRHSLEDAVGMFILGDVLVHTWDLARATNLDETLDADEVRRMLEGLEPMADTLSESGQFGPRVEVRADADEQTRLLAASGRQP